ncbi:unnamed protein product [Orchesella dallaii]|uniref:BTB domain-containing protein n=1 Tax=Orchesella dallaii TaxID=48710 RepID=A0ABP1RWN1_9HEXA
MSAKNNSNSTDSTPSYELCKKTEVSTDTSRTYTFVPGTHDDHFIFIYPIIPHCGFSFMKKVFKFDSDTSTCFSFAHGKELTNGLKNSDCFRGSDLLVIAPKIKIPTNWLQFVLYLKPCKAFISCQEEVARINTMNLKPVSLSLICQLSAGGGTRTVTLKFKPGVTDQFDVEDMDPETNEQHIVYYSSIDSLDVHWCPGLDDFLEFKAGGKLPTITIQVQLNKSISDTGISTVYRLPHYKRLLTTFTLISITGEKHVCHKSVLNDRSAFFARKFKADDKLMEMEIKECSRAIELVLYHIYYPQAPLAPPPSFDEAFGVLKLAQLFELPDLTALSVKCLIKEMDTATVSAIWNLYSTIRALKYKLQIYRKLWQDLLTYIHLLILEVDNDNVDFNDDYYILSMNCLIEFGPSGITLLEQLCNDLVTTREGENKEDMMKHLESQDIVTKFLLEVIKYWSTEVNSISSTSQETPSPKP